jgi:predicted cobalt transporter CbtA
MRKFFILCAALFCLSLTASAQDSTAAFDASSSESDPAAPAPFIPADREAWQLGAGFQYVHFNVLGQNFHNFAYRGDVTRYFTNSVGVEGTAIVGFGNEGGNSSQVANSLFIGGGPHVSLKNTGRFEPWVHALIGWQRFRFTQSGTLGSNSGYAFLLGGGVDYKIGEGRLYWRVQGDYLGAHVGSSFSSNYAFGTGLILNF